MEFNTGRIGPYLSDRLIIADEAKGLSSLAADKSFVGWLLRLISWIYCPSSYTDSNRKTIACVKKYLIDQVGSSRLERICTRYEINLTQMEESGSSLLSRHVAKIIIGVKDVKMDDMEELVQFAKTEGAVWPPQLSFDLKGKLAAAATSEDLDSVTFAEAYKQLQNIEIKTSPTMTIEELIEVSKTEGGRWPETVSIEYKELLSGVETYDEIEPETLELIIHQLSLSQLPEIVAELSGAEPSEVAARYFFDPFLADRERLVLGEENAMDSYETFVHNFVIRIIGREMEVGMLVPAPNKPSPSGFPDPEGAPRFYRVSAKIITAAGMVSYVLSPATKDSGLDTIRFFRGTSTRSSAIDCSSTMITDSEPELGYSAFQSGEIYEETLKAELEKITVAAGHSLGSTTLQYILVKNADIKIAYLYNGPGIMIESVDDFNQRMSQPGVNPITLFIRDAHFDIFSTVGKIHLGFEAPEDTVTVIYSKYFPRASTAAGYAHVQVPERENPYYGIEGGHSRKEVDQLLNRQDLPCTWEPLRRVLGPILAVITRIVRNIFRFLFGSRAEQLRGLQIGKFDHGHWITKHYRYEDLIKLSAPPLIDAVSDETA
jgi:hypothetical protein